MQEVKKRALMIGLDGADPLLIKTMISEGRLPNLKRMIDEGTAPDSLTMLGAYPSVTPPNWASMATGNWPRTHGVTCYANHTLGKDLGTLELNWDSRRVKSEMIWETFSREGKKSIMLNYCEAWPPRFEDKNSIYIDGTGVFPFMRCNVDYQKVIKLEKGDFETIERPHVTKSSSNDCVVEGDQFAKMKDEASEDAVSSFDAQFDPMVDVPVLLGTKNSKREDDEADFIIAPLKEADNWGFILPDGALTATVILNDGLTRRYIVIYPSANQQYDTVAVYANRKDDTPLAVVKNGQWQFPVYDYYTKEDKKVKVAYGLRVLNMAADGSSAEIFLTHAVNMEDLRYTYPKEVGKALYEAVGPECPYAKFGRHMTDCVDVLYESVKMIHDWHIAATKWLLETNPDWDLFYVHLHSIDLYGHWYINFCLPGTHPRYAEFLEMYKKVYELNDEYVGYILSLLDENTAAFVTSDHGIIPNSPGDHNPGTSHLLSIGVDVMEELGYTVVKTDENGMRSIDWSKTKAVLQRSSYLYLNLKGRDPYGIVEPEDYQETLDEIISALYSYRHPDSGKRVFSFCLNREEMETVGVGGSHVGDALVQLMPTYCREHAFCPTTVTNEGFSLHNLCLMMGGGFKKQTKFQRIVRVVDVAPTIAYLCGVPMPANTEGGVIWQALEGFDEKVYE